MIQKTYHFYNLNELQQTIDAIRTDDNFTNSSAILMQLYNPRLDIDEDTMVNVLNKNFPNAFITGVTAANIAEAKYDISTYYVELSVTFFKDTSLVQFDFDMNSTTAFVAGRILNESLDVLEDIKCLQIFYTSSSISINTFRYEFRHYNLPIFGIKAGRSITQQNIAHVYGKKVYTNGFVVVAFLSKKLKLYMDNNLGWRPIGVKMIITKTSGGNVIEEINKKPATDIYSKYLNVSPNKYFVENVCEFPLILERNEMEIARVPSGYSNNGSIMFTSDIHVGDYFRLSYATKDALFAQTEESVADISKFNPEAIYLFECGNRHRFLNKNYKHEIKQYMNCLSNLSFVTGYAELFVTPDGAGGDLNSSLVAVGLKECNDDSEDVFIPSRHINPTFDKDSKGNRKIPFINRILSFLESTSKELDDLNQELGKIAYTDQLTKIYNRWELEHKLDDALELNRQGKRYGLLFFDIDHFKHINDTYGHDIGDNTLLAVVDIIKANLNDGHAFGRWGGEEFIYLYPATDADSLISFAESIRKTIDEACFVTIQHLTISIGATMARLNDSNDSFLKRADTGVYHAKENGRNRVVFIE